ncbi:hypothetical protein [Solidesulfovibrio fructosivorans]|uniref:hypothetical protein n=1 Tax=Solidesulfovibrio fructosivorans TaxID=878 RepID=UPI0005C22287|nr:hypothetical protein [Solidesulfovibrio fructosivorans]
MPFIISLLWAALVLSGLFYLYKRQRWPFKIASSFLWLILLSAPFLYILCVQPIYNWDARSIWFFHGKILYYAHRLGNHIGFERALSIGYDAHMDYPKLVSSLSALAAQTIGFWNEYIPKASLVTLFLLGLIGLSSLRILSLASKSMLLTAWIIITYYNAPGQTMDAWLSFYSMLSVLFFLEFFEYKESSSFACCIITSLLLLSLKNEGNAIFIILIILYASIFYIQRSTVRLCMEFKQDWLIYLIALIPIILWETRKIEMRLHVDLDLYSSNALEHLSSRANLSTVYEFSYYLFYVCNLFLTPLTICFAIILPSLFSIQRIWKIKIFRYSIIIASSFFLMYTLTLSWVYFTTHHEFTWHLANSAIRVIQPIKLIGFVPLALFFSVREKIRG